MEAPIESPIEPAPESSTDIMPTPIYGLEAAGYFERGFVVVPIQPDEKRPVSDLTNWPSYLHNPPGEKKWRSWIESYPNNGIGILLGGDLDNGHRLIGIDVDVDALVRATRTILGPSPCEKVGKKGTTTFAQVPETAKMKSGAISTAEKGNGIDVLFKGKMALLPGSIHPETGLPYRWIGQPLLDCDLKMLPVFDEAKLQLLKCVVGSPEALALISGQATHDPALSLVAKLVRLNTDDTLIEEIVRALLPVDYNGDTLKQIPEMIASARAKGFDVDAGEDDGETNADKAVKLIRRLNVDLFKCDDRAYASERLEGGGLRTYLVESSAFAM